MPRVRKHGRGVLTRESSLVTAARAGCRDPPQRGQCERQAGLAQLVERFSCKEDVVGSSPTPGSRGGRTSRVRILVVTNAYPSAERPSYGIYVARLVAALERGGHEVELAAASEQGGGWRTLVKYWRLDRRARAAARALPARGRVGPLPRADRDDRAPRREGRRRALCADGARHRRRERRALAAHPRRHGQGRRRRLRRLRRLGGSGRAARGGHRAARRAARTSSARASTCRPSPTATRRSRPPRSAGTATARASSASPPTSRARTCCA